MQRARRTSTGCTTDTSFRDGAGWYRGISVEALSILDEGRWRSEPRRYAKEMVDAIENR